jgi:hypothetical protein
MKRLAAVVALILVTGCSLLPRAHDPVMFGQLVTVDITIRKVDCDRPDWKTAVAQTQHLAQYAAWRSDPQAANLDGLHKHAERMNQGGSKTFCELGKKTAAGRIQAAKTAWEGR